VGEGVGEGVGDGVGDGVGVGLGVGVGAPGQPVPFAITPYASGRVLASNVLQPT
jgi:hypothetical protein